jgi:hypothetical protein
VRAGLSQPRRIAARRFLSCDGGHVSSCRNTVICLTAHSNSSHDEDSTMDTEPVSAETTGLHLRPDLVAALNQSGVVKKRDFHVESFKPSLLVRFARLFASKRQR